MTGRRTTSHVVTIAALVAGVLASGCAWQPYVVSRGIRHLTGSQKRFHTIVPLTTSLRPYRIVEVMPLQNLLGAAMPMATERDIDDRVVDGLRTLPTSPQIVVIRNGPLGPADDPSAASGGRTLRVEGVIDDLDGGSLPLRIAELGFNHVAVTVRIRLRDKATSRLLGAASFTAQDDRVTASTNAAIHNLAKQIRAYVQGGYER